MKNHFSLKVLVAGLCLFGASQVAAMNEKPKVVTRECKDAVLSILKYSYVTQGLQLDLKARQRISYMISQKCPVYVDRNKQDLLTASESVKSICEAARKSRNRQKTLDCTVEAVKFQEAAFNLCKAVHLDNCDPITEAKVKLIALFALGEMGKIPGVKLQAP